MDDTISSQRNPGNPSGQVAAQSQGQPIPPNTSSPNSSVQGLQPVTPIHPAPAVSSSQVFQAAQQPQSPFQQSQPHSPSVISGQPGIQSVPPISGEFTPPVSTSQLLSNQQQPMKPISNVQVPIPSQNPAQPNPQPPTSALGVVQQSPQNPPFQNQPMQPIPSQQISQAPSASQEESPRITLEDLYGPSDVSAASPQEPARPNPIAPQPISSQPISPMQQITPQEEIQQPISQPQFNMSRPQHEPLPTATLQPDEPPHKEAPNHDDETSKGFHFPNFLKLIIGGAVLLVVFFFIISAISSLFKGNTTTKVTITYWGLWEDSNVYQPIIADFEKSHPNITINYVKEDPKDYPARLITRIQNGSGPDIFTFHNTWLTPLQSILLPLPSTVIDPQQLQTQYFPVVRQDLVKNGALYGLPFSIDTLALYTNKAIFDHAGAKIPSSWDQFITVAKALTVKDPSGKIKTAGTAMGAFDNISHAPDIISLLLMQNGANLLSLDKSQNAIDALNFYTSFAKTDNNVWDTTLDNSLLAFSRGSVAMYFGYSYDYFAIKAANPNLQFEIHPVPHLAGRDMTIASYWAEGISAKSQHQKEALEFMQYLAQKSTQTALYTQEAKTRPFGEIYARSDLAEGLQSSPIVGAFVSQAKNAVSSFFAGDTYFDNYNGALNQYLGNAINSILGNTSPDTALETLSQGVTQVLSQYAPKTQ